MIKRYNILTSGKRCLESGKIIGYAHAKDPLEAENNLIKSGQISEKQRGFFNYVEQNT